MAIEFFSDKITFGNFSLKLTDSGMEVINLTNNAAGKLYATDFQGFGTFQGSVAGFTSGGYTITNVIDKFPFAADTNATDVGDLTQSRYQPSGQSSTVSGYSSGGNIPPGFSTHTNVIDKFAFANTGNATDVGDLTTATGQTSGQSSTVSGYASGGRTPTPLFVTTINKFPFSTDSNAINAGGLTVARQNPTGNSSTTHGYASGGNPSLPGAPGSINTIEKFPFSSDTNATDVGDLTTTASYMAGQSSKLHGYVSGFNTNTNTIEKFPFTTDTNSSDVGDLSQVRGIAAGQSSTNHGYTSGGYASPSARLNTIDKFPFSTDTNATDVGDLTVGRSDIAGQQF